MGIWRDAREYSSERGSAARALAKLGDPQAINDFLAVLKDRGVSSDLRSLVVEAVGFSGDRRARDALAAVLDGRREPLRVRETAVRAIERVQGKEAISLLSQIARRKGEDPRIQFSAVECIVRLTDGAIESTAMVDTLAEGVYDEEAFRNSDSTRVEYRDNAIRGALEKIVQHGKTKEVRARAAEIARMREKSAPSSGLGRPDERQE
jgi:HEAT repeat protein